MQGFDTPYGMEVESMVTRTVAINVLASFWDSRPLSLDQNNSKHMPAYIGSCKEQASTSQGVSECFCGVGVQSCPCQK
jgi:hypothetical protein